jgi:hypothetical protein
LWLSHGFRLNLPKLRELTISNCSFKVLSIFDRLNDDVLEELSLQNFRGFSTRKYFENQRNIKRLKTDRTDLLNLQQLKLEQVELNSLDEPTLEGLRGQDKITVAKFLKHRRNSNLDMSELKSLEILKVDDSLNFSIIGIDLSSHRNLRRVLITNGFMSIKSEFLQELILPHFGPSNSTLAEIAANCPNLRLLDLSRVDTGSLFLHFPKLECFRCNSIKNSSESLDHEHLKRLCVRFDSANLIVKHCVNLESLNLNFYNQASKESVENLLRSAPRLKALILNGKTQDFVDIEQEFVDFSFGENLEFFRCRTSLNLEWLKGQLKNRFDEFRFKDGFFTAKKKGTEFQSCFCCEYNSDIRSQKSFSYMYF